MHTLLRWLELEDMQANLDVRRKEQKVICLGDDKEKLEKKGIEDNMDRV